MRVVAILDSLTPGGTETSTVLLGSRLIEMGVDFSIVTLRDTDPDLTDLAANGGIPIHLLNSDSAREQLFELRRTIRALRPDIVHTALFRADQLGRVASAFTGTKVVSSLVNTPYVAERLSDPNVVKWRLRAAQMVDAATSCLFVDRFHAVSDGVKSENARALRLPLAKITVAERGRSSSSLGERTPERQRRARLSLRLSDTSPVILNVGRQEFQKGQLDLIQMSQQLTRQGREHRVLVAGKPGSASHVLIEALDDDANAPARVTLLGQRDDVGDLLAAADILVISSHFEGTAGAALEAMAVGTPIVSTDVVGIRGILEHERNALLVPVSQPTEITSAVTRLLDDPTLAAHLAQRGQQDFAERFTLEHAAASMLHLYESVLSDTSA